MFVDVHSHVVPSGDDGASGVEEGLALCRDAARRGTSILYATPHVWPHLLLDERREEQVRRAHAGMAAQAAEWGLDLRLGWELTPTRRLLREDPGRYRLGGLAAVLLEVPFLGPVEDAERLAEHVEGQGLTPIVAHPERSEGVLADPAVATAWSRRGWLLQLNATSLLGRHGPAIEETAWLLLERGDARLVGSDGHRVTRPPFLDAAHAEVAARVGETAARPFFNGSALAGLGTAEPAVAERR